MKTTLSAKLLQHLASKKKADQGFTLIELLVVIIIIGILAAIALPSFLNQANKAKQTEAKTYIGSMNRAQQAYYLEKDQFAGEENLASLGLGIDTTTTNYNYSAQTNAAKNAAPGRIVQVAVPAAGATAALKAYSGGVGISTINSGTTSADATTVATLCEALYSPVQGGVITAPEAIATVGFGASPNFTPDCTGGTGDKTAESIQ